LAHNIAIKKFFEPWMSKGKRLMKKSIKVHRKNTNQGIFLKSLLWLVNQNLFLKIIFLSFIAILGAKMSCVNKALRNEAKPLFLPIFVKNCLLIVNS